MQPTRMGRPLHPLLIQEFAMENSVSKDNLPTMYVNVHDTVCMVIAIAILAYGKVDKTCSSVAGYHTYTVLISDTSMANVSHSNLPFWLENIISVCMCR